MLKKHELVSGRKNNEESFVLFYFVWSENRKKVESGWSLRRQTVRHQQPPSEGKRNSEGEESKNKEGVSNVLVKGATH